MTEHALNEIEKAGFDLTLERAIRLLYHVALNHCVLRSLEQQKIICVSKDQLVSLLERGHSGKKLKELFSLADKKEFKPSNMASFFDAGNDRVLAVTEDGASVISVAKAFAHIEHEFPEWWSVPLPLVFLTKDKVTLNGQAENLHISKLLQRIDRKAIPLDQDEFFVTLEEKNKSHSVMFKHLGRKIYLIEDVTRDVETAGDIVWWASVGKALTMKLECEGKFLWRDGEPDSGLAEESFACEWDGKNVGVLCVGKKKTKPKARKK